MDAKSLAEQNDPDRPDDPYRPNGRENYDPVEDMGDVLQDQEYDARMVVVPVCVKEPVRTQELPSALGGLMRKAVPDVAAGGRPVKLLDGDPRRKRAVLVIPAEAVVQLGPTDAQAASEFSFTLTAGANGPERVEFHSSDEVWGVGNGSAFSVSVLNEQWAE